MIEYFKICICISYNKCNPSTTRTSLMIKIYFKIRNYAHICCSGCGHKLNFNRYINVLNFKCLCFCNLFCSLVRHFSKFLCFLFVCVSVTFSAPSQPPQVGETLFLAAPQQMVGPYFCLSLPDIKQRKEKLKMS